MKAEFEFQKPGSSAFEFLREEAWASHLCGDGLAVNHLVSIGISAFRRLEEPASVPPQLLTWLPTLGLYWMTHYSSRYEFERFLEKLKEEHKEFDCALLKSIYTLATEPFAYSPEEEEFETLSFRPNLETEPRELSLQASYAIELVWYRDPHNPAWRKLAGGLSDALSSEGSGIAPRLIERLEVQAALTRPLTTSTLPDCLQHHGFPEEDSLFRVWKEYARQDHDAVAAAISESLRRNPSSMRDGSAFSLSAFTHAARFSSWYRETQPDEDSDSIRLFRHLYMASVRPADRHHSCRVDRLSDLWENVQSLGSVAPADSRFSLGCLAMLDELFSLREWNFSEWSSSLKWRMRACLSVAIADEDCQFEKFHTDALEFAVRSACVDTKKTPALAATISALQFCSTRTLEELVARLLASHPLDWEEVRKLFELLGDLIPESCLTDVADWCSRYLDAILGEPKKLSTVRPLNFWRPILSELPRESEVFDHLVDTVCRLCADQRLWPGSEKVVIPFVVRADLELARRVASSIAGVLTSGSGSKHEYGNHVFWLALYEFEARHDLESPQFASLLEKRASIEIEHHYVRNLSRRRQSKSGAVEDGTLKGFLKTKLLEPGFAEVFGLVTWDRNDREDVAKLIPQVRTSSHFSIGASLLDYQAPPIYSFLRRLRDILKASDAGLVTALGNEIRSLLSNPPSVQMEVADEANTPFSMGHVDVLAEPIPVGALCAIVDVTSDLLSFSGDDWNMVAQLILSKPLDQQSSGANWILYTCLRIALLPETSDRLCRLMIGTACASFVFLVQRQKFDRSDRVPLADALGGLQRLMDIDDFSEDSPKSALEPFWLLFERELPSLGRNRNRRIRAALGRLILTCKHRGLRLRDADKTLSLLREDASLRVRQSVLRQP